MSARRLRFTNYIGHPQLALGLEPARHRDLDRPGARVAAAAELIAGAGFEVAAVAPGRWNLSVEAALRDWTLTLGERGSAVVARAYVMRAPQGGRARSGLLETILEANAGSANARFALEGASVVVDATLAYAEQALVRDALCTAILGLTRTCNDAYPRLLALAANPAEAGESESLVLRVA